MQRARGKASSHSSKRQGLPYLDYSLTVKTPSSLLIRLRRTRMHHADTHCDLVQNTALRSLNIRIEDVNLFVEDQERNMPQIAKLLHDVLSTVRSHQLEYLEIKIWVAWGPLFGSVRRGIELAALHETMSQPHFNALKGVNVTMVMRNLRCRYLARVEDVCRTFEASFRRLLQPWDDRGIVKRVAPWTRTDRVPDPFALHGSRDSSFKFAPTDRNDSRSAQL
ncbi:uncharacterized protein B0H18DRAFT_1013264 [Fomitopsis serialis]|uniref:uncharacterized protein n=1 Tax=Fomitopsis serialis TaxID=139415 RepID=UPI002008A8A5|nr:uncharacterized protein B0H18DRAFT_1013264 [Neoantrodia serialis]KAH9924057.1 hypothetical protein B0H18DRAFT_1013264 [Neoantrodia serialis]